MILIQTADGKALTSPGGSPMHGGGGGHPVAGSQTAPSEHTTGMSSHSPVSGAHSEMVHASGAGQSQFSVSRSHLRTSIEDVDDERRIWRETLD